MLNFVLKMSKKPTVSGRVVFFIPRISCHLFDYLMAKSSFIIPFCFRKGWNDKESSKGFFLVDTCLLLLDHEASTILIFEEDEYKENAKPAATFDLRCANLCISLKTTKSKNNNFRAGRLTFSGMKESPEIKEIILEMEFEKYKAIKQWLLERK